MTEGELRCMGSSLFLKSLYGVGYTLTVIRKDGPDNYQRQGQDPDQQQTDRDLGGDNPYSAGVTVNDGGILMVSWFSATGRYERRRCGRML